MRGGARRVYGLLAGLPQAEREALAPTGGLALEVAQEAAGPERLRVGAIVALAQEVEVGHSPPDGAEDD